MKLNILLNLKLKLGSSPVLFLPLFISSLALAQVPLEYGCTYAGTARACGSSGCRTVRAFGLGFGETEPIAQSLGLMSCEKQSRINRAIYFSGTFQNISECSNERCFSAPMGEPVITSKFNPISVSMGGRIYQECLSYGGRISTNWYLDRTLLSGATDDTLVLTDQASATLHGQLLTCVTQNEWGRASKSAIISLSGDELPPVISRQIEDIYVEVDARIPVSCPISGSDLNYRWFVDGEYIDGVSGAIISFDNFLEPISSDIICEGSNAYGILSARFQLNIVAVGAIPPTPTPRPRVTATAPPAPTIVPPAPTSVPAPTPTVRVTAAPQNTTFAIIGRSQLSVKIRRSFSSTFTLNNSTAAKFSLARRTARLAISSNGKLTGLINKRGTINITVLARGTFGERRMTVKIIAK